MYGSAGASAMEPPFPASSSELNAGTEWRSGTAHQSIEPSSATKAAERPSPMPI
jgi:hypothetical protein